MFTFITKSFLDHSADKNHRNFSPAAGMYWLIKLPALPLNHCFKKLPQTLFFITKLLTAQSVYNISQFFRPRRKFQKIFLGMRLDLLYRHDFYHKNCQTYIRGGRGSILRAKRAGHRIQNNLIWWEKI